MSVDLSIFSGLNWSIIRSRPTDRIMAIDLRRWMIRGKVPEYDKASFFVKYVEQYHKYVV